MPSIYHFRTKMIYEFYLGIQIMSVFAILFFINNLNIRRINSISGINIFIIIYTLYILIKLIVFIRKAYFQNKEDEIYPHLLVGFLDCIFLAQFLNIVNRYLPIASHLFYFYIIFQIILFNHKNFALFSTFVTLCYIWLTILKNPKLLISYDFIINVFFFYLLGYIISSVINEMNRLQNHMNYMYKDLEEKNKQLSEIANRDYLTNMYNHKCFYLYFNNIIEKSQDNNTSFSLALFDIDNFKKINDTYGHLAGDKILKQVSSLILENIRKSDIAARYGGEEFAVIFPNTTLDQAISICERIRDVIENYPFNVHDEIINITISGGVSSGYCCKSSCQQYNFIESVDQLLYKAKSSGKNQIQSD